MDKDFWDKAFGGKDMLRLSIRARNFRIRKNRYSSTATFEYGEGMRVRIVYGMLGFGEGMRVRIVYRMLGFREITPSYMIHGGRGTDWCNHISSISYTVQELTGLVLNCFE